MGIQRRLKLYSGLNLIGWVVAMPLLMVGLLSPFVNFTAWPGASATEKKARVALLPPRLTEHGVLPPLTAKPQPSAQVPEHATIVHAFTSAVVMPTPRRIASGAHRRLLVRSGRGVTRRSPRPLRTAPGGVRRTRRPGSSTPSPNVSTPAPAQDPLPAGPPPGNANKPQDPQHEQAVKPEPAPQQQNGNARPDEPQPGQTGKTDDPQHGKGGKPDDPNNGGQGKPE